MGSSRTPQIIDKSHECVGTNRDILCKNRLYIYLNGFVFIYTNDFVSEQLFVALQKTLNKPNDSHMRLRFAIWCYCGKGQKKFPSAHALIPNELNRFDFPQLLIFLINY